VLRLTGTETMQSQHRRSIHANCYPSTYALTASSPSMASDGQQLCREETVVTWNDRQRVYGWLSCFHKSLATAAGPCRPVDVPTP